MAEKKSTKTPESAKVVRRVKASDDKPAAKASVKSTTKVDAKTAKKATNKPAKAAKKTSDKKSKMPHWIRAIGAYFAGSWYELRQVRWPNRKATWSMTAAVLAFTAFFAILVLASDWVFNYLIKEVIL